MQVRFSQHSVQTLDLPLLSSADGDGDGDGDRKGAIGMKRQRKEKRDVYNT